VDTILAVRLIGIGLIFFALMSVFRGRISVVRPRPGFAGRWVTRADQPVQFWAWIGLEAALGLALVLNLFNF
jgi:hypothetical protein